MKARFKLYLTLFFIMIVSMILIGCTGTIPASNTLPSDKYVAIYEELTDYGTLVNNTTDVLQQFNAPGLRPFIDYNSTGTYRDYQKMNDSYKIFYLTVRFREDPGIRYVNFSDRDIYDYPYTCESGLTVLDVDSNGTVYASYDNKSVVLTIGDKWQSPVSSRIESERIMVNKSENDNISIVYEPFDVRYNSTWTVKNMGMYNKSNLTENHTK